MLAVAAAGDADVGFARLAGAVDDAAEDRERHRGLDMLERILEPLHGADDVETLPRAARARHDADAAGPEAERFQYLVADAHLFLGFGRQADADRVADPGPQQVADAERRLDRAADQSPRFGDPRSEEHTSELQSLMRISYAVFCLKKKKTYK